MGLFAASDELCGDKKNSDWLQRKCNLALQIDRVEAKICMKTGTEHHYTSEWMDIFSDQ